MRKRTGGSLRPGQDQLFINPVTGSPGGNPTAGTVAFAAAGVPLGTASVNAAGIATLTLPAPSAGTLAVTAAFLPAPGSAYASGQTLVPALVTVVTNPAVPVAAVTTLTAQASGRSGVSASGFRRPRRVEFSARVSTPLAAPAVGSVQLLVGGRMIAVTPLGPTGQATFTLAARSVAGQNVIAQFLGGTSGTTPLLVGQSTPVVPRRTLFHGHGRRRGS